MDRKNNLTKRFQVAVRLFSNRSQMTSKCGKSKKVQPRSVTVIEEDSMLTRTKKLRSAPEVSTDFFDHANFWIMFIPVVAMVSFYSYVNDTFQYISLNRDIKDDIVLNCFSRTV